jgi:hypothetical protein
MLLVRVTPSYQVNTKQCYKCTATEGDGPLQTPHLTKLDSKGKRWICRECNTTYKRELYARSEKHREMIKRHSRAFIEAHRDELNLWRKNRRHAAAQSKNQ